MTVTLCSLLTHFIFLNLPLVLGVVVEGKTNLNVFLFFFFPSSFSFPDLEFLDLESSQELKLWRYIYLKSWAPWTPQSSGNLQTLRVLPVLILLLLSLQSLSVTAYDWKSCGSLSEADRVLNQGELLFLQDDLLVINYHMIIINFQHLLL